MSATVSVPRRSVADRARTPGRRSAAARPPRRVSGPAGGRIAARGRSAVVSAPHESVALPGRALAVVRGLPDHSLIDRLVRGRAWIPVLGVLLVGIVAMQVEILKLGSTMGRAMERSSVLQTQNESLQAGVAGLADDQRIERLAAATGMSMPTPDSLVFLPARPSGDVGGALASIHTPDPSGFVAQLAAQAAAAAALMPAPPPATSGASTTISTVGASSSPAATTSVTPASPAATPTTSTSASTPSASAPSPAVAPTAAATTTGATNSGATSSGTAYGSGSGSGAGNASGAAGIAPATSQSNGSTGG